MLLQELKEVIEIDTHIQKIHQQLVNLYDRRNRIIKTTEQDATTVSASALKSEILAPHISWPEQQYIRLAALWNEYGVGIGEFSQYEKRLVKAQSVIQKLSIAYESLRGSFEVVLVPPTGMFKYDQLHMLRQRQSFVLAPDSIDPDIARPRDTRTWAVLVASTAKHGIPVECPASFMQAESYLVAGYDTRALGVNEYIALSLQQKQPIDTECWTVLLKGLQPTDLMPSVTFKDGRYTFAVDEMDGVLSTEHFRPAVRL